MSNEDHLHNLAKMKFNDYTKEVYDAILNESSQMDR